MEALNKSASYRYDDTGGGELMLVGITVRKSGKARCGLSLPMGREDEGELIDQAWEPTFPSARESSKALSAAARPGSI